MDELSALVLTESDDPDLAAVARAVQHALGALPEAGAQEADPGAPIALPLGAELPAQLRDARVVVALDPEADELAREADVATRVVLFPHWGLRWTGPLDADLVLVAHEGLVADAGALGASRGRVRVVGPVAPSEWAPHADRAAIRQELGIVGSCAVVRAEALDRHDLAPSLVQLSLVRGDCTWLFDVGTNPALARELRRRVPGYGLDALMFADGESALASYQAADVVLGRLEGPEVLRALAVGASVVAVAPRSSEARVAHMLETEGLAQIADAAATLAVTLDAALSPEAVARGRAAALATDPAGGAERVATRVRELLAGELSAAPPTGLPAGLERLDAGDEGLRDGPPPSDDADKAVDDELAALRAKLGL